MNSDDREKWLKRRRLGIGGSEAAACTGLDPWRTRLDVYLEKTGQAQAFTDTDALYWARMLEPIVIAEYEKRMAISVRGLQSEHVHPMREWQRCTLDGLTSSAIVEAKTWHRIDDKWGDDGTDQIPMQYVAQCLHNMEVTQMDVCHVPVLFLADKTFRIYVVKYDEALANLLTVAEHEVWEAVQTNNPPEPITLSDINKLWREDDGGEVVASPTLVESIGRLQHVKHVQKELKATREQLEAEIKKYMGPAATLLDEDGERELATWKHNKTKRCDVKALREDEPDTWERYATESTVRTLRIKGIPNV